MRYGLPRSVSPRLGQTIKRNHRRRRCTFDLYSDSEDESDSYTNSDAESGSAATTTDSSSSSDSDPFCYDSESDPHDDAWHAARQVVEEEEEVQAVLAALELRRKSDEDWLHRASWKERDRWRWWERVEAAIKVEENKMKEAWFEALRRTRDEDAEKKKKKRREEEEAREREESWKHELRREEARMRNALGYQTAEDEWRYARTLLLGLKAGPMKNVKSHPQMKSAWRASRRQIRLRIGQLTNDREAIARITRQIYDVLVPPSGAHVRDMYHALLSALSKAILLQAETEVTAARRSAGPLAEVTANLLCVLPAFAEVLFAKVVQRVGGWAVPCCVVVVPQAQTQTQTHDAQAQGQGTQWKKDGREWLSGEGEEGVVVVVESTSEYVVRVSGIMRVYFAILKKTTCVEGLGPRFQMPRCWMWFVRVMMGDREMLEAPAAPELIYVALDELGRDAKVLWGQPWMELLELVREGVTTGLGGGDDRFVIGGESAEGKAARVRVQLEIERITMG